MPLPQLKQQEIPFDHPDSNNMFRPSADKPFVATPGAIDAFQQETLIACLNVLQQLAKQQDGIDYLQVFDCKQRGKLWYIEDGAGGAVTALTPEEY